MKLKSLKLENFRNYDSIEVEIDKNLTALVGDNAQGKSNFLESVAFLALGKSFRTNNFVEVLSWERPHGRIQGCFETIDSDKNLEVFFEREPQRKKFKKQEKLSNHKDFMGTFRVVIFTPENLNMISGSPFLRRQYFDRLLVQVSREYFESFSNFEKILKQRNALLKRIKSGFAKSVELDVWDEKMAREAGQIWEERRCFTEFLNGILTNFYRSISGGNESLEIKYYPENTNCREKLLMNRESDIASQHTGLGPHRDDFKIYLNGRDIAEVGSRGEQRSAVMALKMGHIKYIEEKTGQKPILLLDDIFSELDSERQKHLINLIKDYQTIITNCSFENIKTFKNARVYKVTDGILSDVLL